MKNVLEIINLSSSARNFIGDQFSYLQENGDYRLHLICTPDGQIDEFVKKQKISYRPVRLERQLSPISDIKAFFSICKYIRSNHIDVVIAHQAKARLLGTMAAFLLRVPHRIIFAHGVLYETMHGFKRWLIKTNDRFVSLLCNKVVCVSHYVLEARGRDGIDKCGKCVILGSGSCNGIDAVKQFNPSRFSIEDIVNLKQRLGVSDGDFIVGFCGRLVRDKGVNELVDGFSKLLAKHPEKKIYLLVIGAPESRDALPQSLMDYIRNSKNIIFTNAVPYNRIAMYYMLMDVFILPSHREGLGMVALEAAAMEKPVLVTFGTGCRETIISGETGSYIHTNGDNIAESLEKYMNKQFAVQQGANGRKFVLATFERQLVNRNMLNFLNEITGNGIR